MSIPLTQELFEERFDELLRTVKEGFDATASKVELEVVRTDLAGVKTDLATVKSDLAAVKTDLAVVKTKMVTRDHLDDKLADLKGDLIVKLRKTNEKLDFIVALLRARAVLSDDDIKNIRSEFQIFPTLT